MIKYLFFDIGYTLVNEDDVWHKRCQELAKTNEASDKNLSFDEIYTQFLTLSQNSYTPFKDLLKKYGFSIKIPYDSTLEKPYPGISDFLNTISARFKLGIIANQSSGLCERLEKFGILHHFSTVVFSHDCGFDKPSPQIFLHALEKADVSPSVTAMIGDRFDNDILPAKNLGMKTILVRQGFGRKISFDGYASFIDYQIDSIFNLPDILM